jgi:GGDEF domain-containing protein
MLDQMSTTEVNIGFIYSVLDLLARRYRLTDAVVVLRDESLGTQAFRLGQKSLPTTRRPVATSPGVFCEPDVVPHVVRDVVRNVCQLALTLHLARHSADHDPLTSISNRRHFDAALRNAAVQSARYGWAFTLVLIDLDGFKAINDRLGHAAGDDMLRSFGWALRRSVRSGDTTAGWAATSSPSFWPTRKAPRSWPSPSACDPFSCPFRSSTSRSAPPRLPRRFDRPRRAVPHRRRPALREERHRAPMTSTIEEDFELELRSLPGVVNVGINHRENGEVEAVVLFIRNHDPEAVRESAVQVTSLYFPDAAVILEEASRRPGAHGERAGSLCPWPSSTNTTASARCT